MKSYVAPVVPTELQPHLTDEVLAVHEVWQGLSVDSVEAMTPLPLTFENRGSYSRAVLIGGDPQAGVNVFTLPYQQAWKPSTAIRALFHHAVNNPDGLTVVLPQNSLKLRDQYHQYSDAELAETTLGNMRSTYEQQVRVLESISRGYGKFGKIKSNGYSLGGLTALGIATVESDVLNFEAVNSIEAPSLTRLPRTLQKDFLKSGTLKDQRAAIADSKLPVLDKALRLDRLMLDYLQFGLAGFTAYSKALKSAMATPEFRSTVISALDRNANLQLRLGYVSGSEIFHPRVVAGIGDERVTLEEYTGAGSHRHATGDNPVALALMFR